MASRSAKDLLIIIAAVIIATFIELYTGIIDQALIWIERLDHFLLTELFVILLIGTVGFSIYAWRRWHELVVTQTSNQQLQQSVIEIEGLNQRYRSYAEAVTHGQEEERLRLARELHDDTIHRLILLNQQVELTLFDHGDNPVATDISKMQTILSDTINSIRRFIQELRPSYLDEIGLIPALRILTQEKKERTGINFQFEVEGEAKRLSTDTELALYRITQTALRNVLLHSQADRAKVTLSFEPDLIKLFIVDNGVGFEVPDFSDLAKQGNFGLIGMYERAALHQATFNIASEIGKGTTVSVEIPA